MHRHTDGSAHEPQGPTARGATSADRNPEPEAMVRALQRSAGNGAVARALAAEVTTTVPDVLRSGGRPLPGSLRSEMEARLGADFSDVRLHTGPAAQRSAAEIGARAYTSGPHVVLGAGGGDRHTLAHELTHVVQQRSGPVAGTPGPDGLTLSDPGDQFERAADAAARAALRGPVPDVSPAASDAPAATADGAVQRLVEVADGSEKRAHTDDKNRVKPEFTQADAADLMKRVTEAVDASGDPELQAAFAENLALVTAQAKKWVADTEVGTLTGHSAFGSKRRVVTYPSYLQVARALVGWVRQKPGRHDEKVLAQQVYGDEEVAKRLDTVLRKIEHWIATLKSTPPRTFFSGGESTEWLDLERLRKELETGEGLIKSKVEGHWKEFGTYQHHLDIRNDEEQRTRFKGNFMAVLQNPDQYPLRDKVVVIHDLYEYFKQRNSGRPNAQTAGNDLLPDTPPEALVSSTQKVESGKPPVRGTDRGTHRGGTTRDEAADSTKMAREQNIPVYAGQSSTAARMLYLSQLAGADTEELTAVALSIFAFWRIDYDHTMDLAYHTLHETMDIAKNFGVPYDQEERGATFDVYADRIKVERQKQEQEQEQRRQQEFERFLENSERTNNQLDRQGRVLVRAVTALEADHQTRLTGGYGHQKRRTNSRTLLNRYQTAAAACRTALQKVTTASAEERPQRVSEYEKAVSDATALYKAVTDLVKTRRIAAAEAAEDAMETAAAPV
ncbi:DUF4157 domain-containing protein [Cryptosporangium japonicum]|uniref:eCIS core domain-containing protein n=1 Tax=Cryptosporangium japonicum TaxID=80872 RepID=A0ABP3DBT1_9ACTN